MAKIYKCEIPECSNTTKDFFCSKCSQVIQENKYIYCSNCGSVVRIIPKSSYKILELPVCNACKNKGINIWYYQKILARISRGENE